MKFRTEFYVEDYNWMVNLGEWVEIYINIYSIYILLYALYLKCSLKLKLPQIQKIKKNHIKIKKNQKKIKH